MSSHLELTFGIELELLVAGRPNFGPKDGAAFSIYHAFRRRGIPTLPDKVWDGFVAENNGSFYSGWRVGHDFSLELSDEEEANWPAGYTNESIELASRVFKLRGDDDWVGEIRALLDALAEVESFGYRMLTNNTTGFHVHIGVGNALKACSNSGLRSLGSSNSSTRCLGIECRRREAPHTARHPPGSISITERTCQERTSSSG